jgi:hypothetical protein
MLQVETGDADSCCTALGHESDSFYCLVTDNYRCCVSYTLHMTRYKWHSCLFMCTGVVLDCPLLAAVHLCGTAPGGGSVPQHGSEEGFTDN